MAFDWNEFLTLARELAQRPLTDEAAKRTSVSRAYYAAFHDAFSRAELNRGASPRGKEHVWCWQQYVAAGDNTCNDLGVDGDRLKRQRHRADYDAQPIERLDDFVNRAISDAESIKRRIVALDARYP